MSEYIEREETLRLIEEMRFEEDDNAHNAAEEIYYLVKDMDDADVAPVKRGTWEKTSLIGYLRCSVCHGCYISDIWLDGKHWNFCPHCGADLRGENDGLAD